MKPRRKLTAIVMAAAMMLTMAPAAYAGEIDATATNVDQPTTIWAHGQEVEVPVIESIIPPSNGIASIADTVNSVTITSQEQFENIPDLDWRKGITYYLECDIDLSQMSAEEWGGYIQFFDSNLIGVPDENGRKPVISGFANNRYLIYGMIRGTISNITLQMNGNAGALSYMPTRYTNVTDTSYYKVNIENVDITGHVNLTESDQSNYSPYVFAACAGDFTMKNCTNYADIKGDIYGAVFHGYYALNTTGTYTFENCVNEGEIELRNAAMFFGNPSTMNSKLSATEDEEHLKVNVIGCENNDMIAGSVSAHYFAPSLNGKDYPASETALAEMETSMTQGSPAPVTVAEGAGLCSGKTGALTGEIKDDKSITFSYSNETESAVDHYLVTVGSYVQVWNEEYYNEETGTIGPDWDGTTRYSVSEKITPDGTNDYTATLKYYGVADDNYGLWGDNILNYPTNISEDGTNIYYTIDKYADTNPNLTYYADRTMGSDNQPAGGAFASPSFATVYAIDVNGNIIDFFTLK